MYIILNINVLYINKLYIKNKTQILLLMSFN